MDVNTFKQILKPVKGVKKLDFLHYS